MINEEISTIFVVGFPDDMQEREFQNMFIFSPGFEAATLKIPQKDSPDGDESTNGTNPRKQIIGFAKFRSRNDALDARDVLSGRKVDAEKGSVLKAEMAKKNLHTKRGLSNDQNNQNYPLMQMAKRYPAPSSINTGGSTYDAFHSIPFAPQLPSDLLSPQDYGYDFYSDSVYTPTTPTTPPVYEQPFSARGSFDATNGVIGGLVGAPRGLVNGVRYGNKGFLDGDELNNYLSKSTPVDILTKNKVPPGGFGANPLLLNDDISHRMAQLTLNGNAPVPSTGLSGSPSIATPPGFRPPNPADQNPPCNTLYVGNLPMNTSEDELKQLFSKCPGYKRMCFRTKQNGPMCFVEFEDVNYATQAMNELYGNPLSNSVKGGIRLSFSKNPLGVRSSNNSSTNGDRRDSVQSLHSLERRDSAYSLLSERRDSAYSLERRDSAFSLALERRDSFQLERRDSVTTTGSSGGGSGPAATIAERFEFERRGSASSFLLPPEKRDPYFATPDRRDSLPFDPLA